MTSNLDMSCSYSPTYMPPSLKYSSPLVPEVCTPHSVVVVTLSESTVCSIFGSANHSRVINMKCSFALSEVYKNIMQLKGYEYLRLRGM